MGALCNTETCDRMNNTLQTSPARSDFANELWRGLTPFLGIAQPLLALAFLLENQRGRALGVVSRLVRAAGGGQYRHQHPGAIPPEYYDPDVRVRGVQLGRILLDRRPGGGIPDHLMAAVRARRHPQRFVHRPARNPHQRIRRQRRAFHPPAYLLEHDVPSGGRDRDGNAVPAGDRVYHRENIHHATERAGEVQTGGGGPSRIPRRADGCPGKTKAAGPRYDAALGDGGFPAGLPGPRRQLRDHRLLHPAPAAFPERGAVPQQRIP